MFSNRFTFSVRTLNALKRIRKMNTLKNAVKKTLSSVIPFRVNNCLSGSNDKKKIENAVMNNPLVRIEDFMLFVKICASRSTGGSFI